MSGQPKLNVIQKAKAQAALSTQSRTARTYAHGDQKKPGLEEGELVWVGEYKNRDMRSYKLTKGDKTLMTEKEIKLFHRSVYERGFTEHIYEGQLRLLDSRADPRDPRGATREGQGTMWYPNGSMYEGGWKNDERHGHGFYGTHTNYRFTGEWEHDVGTGVGYETSQSGILYDGSFLGGAPDGQGVLVFNSQQTTGYRYEGEFKNGLRHGKGVIFYDNGDTFAGQFAQGQRNGRGVTTTVANGHDVQYETEWDGGKMVSGPKVIEFAKRQRKPKSTLPLRLQGHLVAADLTKWSVKDDVTELALDHFMKIKLGFEGLDVHGSGSLSTEELTAIWGSGSPDMLEKLDADGNGTVELDEIFAAWYPNVPAHNILRFMQQDINPRVLLRIRGILNRVRDEAGCGYMQICRVEHEDEDDKGLTLKSLEHHEYKIGNEKFTAANYSAAKQLSDPPHFLEILESWYPNIPRSTLERYEATAIDPNELVLIKRDFYRLSNNEPHLQVDQFEEAQEVFQQRISKAYEESEALRQAEQDAAMGLGGVAPTAKSLAQLQAAKKPVAPSEPSSPSPRGAASGEFDDGDEAATAKESEGADTAAAHHQASAVQREMQEGFFKGQPIWKIGNTLRVSVALLKEIDKFEPRLPQCVSLPQLLRYCYPNATCRRMQEILSSKRRGAVPSTASCPCPICTCS